MQIESEKDFSKLDARLKSWKKTFPMFAHDIKRIEDMVNQHIANHGNYLVQHRQSKKHSYLEKAQQEIEEINRIIATVEKVELFALLSKG